MKRTILVIVLITVISLSAATWFVQNQIGEFQTQLSGLRTQNSELQDQNNVLQTQVSELQLQNREQQDRLTDFTSELAKARHLHIDITAFKWIGGFNPMVCVTLSHPVNVTVKNDDVIPVSGLTLTVSLVHKNTGAQIGGSGVTRIGRLNAGETYELSGWATTTIGTSLNDALCMVTLESGGIVLDKGTYNLS
jgi:hypothetical protein